MARILCIEDEAEIRELLVEELSEEGYEVIEAANGILGLGAILQHRPDLVLCDITMPDMDGCALLNELRTNHPDLAELPFMFLSALADRQQILAGKKLGVDDYLTKPIDFELLFATIEARLGQVRRMIALKDEQFVKLYRSFQPQTANDPAGPEAGRSDEVPVHQAAGAQSDADEPVEIIMADDVQDRIRALASESHRTVVAGRIRILGLDENKTALGDQWLGQSKRILGVAQAAIAQRLSKDDIYGLSADNTFLVCFASLEATDGARKTQSIAHDIRERILGIEGLDPTLGEELEVIADAHQITLSEAEMAESNSIVEPVITRLGRAERKAQENEKAKLAEMTDRCEVQAVSVAKADGGIAPIVIADFDKITKMKIASLRRARPASDDLTAEIDILKLERSAAQLGENALGNQPTLIVDVAFSTLNSKKNLKRYLELCASFSKDVSRHLCLSLLGAPNDHPEKIRSLIGSLQRHCRMVMLDLSDVSLGSIDPGTLQIPVLSCDYRSMASWIEKQSEVLQRLLSAIHEKKSRILVYDMPRGADTKYLVRQGVDLMSCAS